MDGKGGSSGTSASDRVTSDHAYTTHTTPARLSARDEPARPERCQSITDDIAQKTVQRAVGAAAEGRVGRCPAQGEGQRSRCCNDRRRVCSAARHRICVIQVIEEAGGSRRSIVLRVSR